MPRFKKVLIAIDTTSEAGRVIDLAKDYVDDGADYSVISVIPPIATVYGSVDNAGLVALTSASEFDQELMADARTKVAEEASSAGLDAGKTVVLRGRPADEICLYAEEGGYDLIVIGSHTRGPIRRLLGSTAAGVLHSAVCDVLLARVPLD